MWLVDKPEPADNPNLDFVLRDEGHTVLLHCVQAQSRTPAVGALYSALAYAIPITQALTDICAALPDAHPNRGFAAALGRLAGAAG